MHLRRLMPVILAIVLSGCAATQPLSPDEVAAAREEAALTEIREAMQRSAIRYGTVHEARDQARHAAIAAALEAYAADHGAASAGFLIATLRDWVGYHPHQVVVLREGEAIDAARAARISSVFSEPYHGARGQRVRDLLILAAREKGGHARATTVAGASQPSGLTSF
ncbi:hypothetical protein J2T57_001563 [Natronocella acetinitrilica]|uniref:Uncharacterized protein n=1 Tax=Natronocella acetinitrilica TaxID=414046 RepID=A0AAE3G2A3_9GAMM|nr:hypothetical protein [Natronocella acetinitrilica]MCP1674461.1 hypothetical protein [Natronocella acetinitrilica]